MVVWNHTAYPQTLWKKTPVARAIPIQLLPKTPKPESLPIPEEVCPDPQTPKLMIRQRHGKLFDELDLSGLASWAPKLADKACQLLAKYHDIFSLDPAELGCTHSTEHTIKVTDDTPFKEHFRRIPPPMVEEVRNHLKEMLESGAIRPSQSAWCIRPSQSACQCRRASEEKRWQLTFLHQLLMPECTYEEGFLSITPNTRGARESGRCRPLLLPGSEVRILADKNGQVVEAIYCLDCG